MTTAPSEVAETTRLFPVPDEPDACDVVVVNGPVAWAFHFSRIVPQYGKLHALTSISWEPVAESAPKDSLGLPIAPFSPIHVDWRSGSSIDSFERRVRNYFDRAKSLNLPWPQMMQFASQRLNEFLFQTGDLKPADWIDHFEPAKYLAHPVWPESNRPVVWFGQGETGKGMMANALAFSMCYGVNLAGLRTKEARRGGIYVDYEDSQEEFSVRQSRFSAGLDMPPSPNLLRFNPEGRLFVDIADQLKGKAAAIGGVDFYIIDSAIPACGGEVNSPEPVGAFFSALARLGKPVLVICHETKQSSGDFPFGSNLWRTMAAMNVQFQGETEPKQDFNGNWVRDILLRCTKANNVRRFQPLAFQLVFTDDERPNTQARTWIRQIASTSVSLELQTKLPPAQRLVAFLREAPSATVKDIVEATGMERGTVVKTLKRGELFRSEGGGRGRGNEARWHVIEGSA